MRTIMLVDMDCFFAACEELRHPEIAGRPVIVGADPKGGTARGVVSTCNYPARRLGIHSAMPISMAYRLKPDAVFLPVDYKFYEETSARVMALIRRFASRSEQVSIDEIFIDVSDKVGKYEEAVEYARSIKKEVKEKLGLRCSIGISCNKLLAKMASDAAKPDGIKLVRAEDAKEFMAPLKIGKMYGVGARTEEKLNSEGFIVIGDIAKSSKAKMAGILGSFGIEVYNYANGVDESGLKEAGEVKSIGRERTFEKDTDNAAEVNARIREISNEVFEEAVRQELMFKTITVKIRYSDFSERLKSRSLQHYSQSLGDIVGNAAGLFEKYAEGKKGIRKIGVRISSLSSRKGQRRL